MGTLQSTGPQPLSTSFAASFITRVCAPPPPAGDGERAAALRKRAAKPRLAEMSADLRVLAAELQRCYGTLNFLPTREDLRLANR